jgi:hypothetical protein
VQTSDVAVVLILIHSKLGILYIHHIQTQGFVGVNTTICFSVAENYFLPSLTLYGAVPDNTQHTLYRHPSPQRDSNPLSQEARGCRPTP